MAGVFEEFAERQAGDACGQFPRIPYAEAMLANTARTSPTCATRSIIAM
jgi:hypothetical protein